ncbi:hypothetical protein GCM10027026_26570 [Myroides odoratimimus subsp. xuanwuensis]
MVAADRAEVAGDAAFALQIVRAHPLGPDGRAFWRPWRVLALEQLVELGPARPWWVTSRWMAAQALQHVDVSTRERCNKALDVAVDLLGGTAGLPGVDQTDRNCQVMDHDWVYRQVHLFELGGLADFVHRVASRELIREAEDMKGWLQAPMGGYRLVGTQQGSVTWEDLAGDDVVTTLDTGAAALVLPGETVLGRLVPAGADRIFESVPLRVAPELAAAVAASPAGWLTLMRQTDERPDTYLTPGTGLASDLRVDVLDAMGGGLGVVLETLDRLACGDDATPPGEVDLWTGCAAALVRPGTLSALTRRLGPQDVPLVERLGERLPEPAASLCDLLLGRLAAAA